ncbi:Six-hairpin glycosidase [Aureobasidium pullulans]|uniref:Six-hairpin glycosidase n=1 Tax=Aureobasidium pullulans TaxID=5580 RepID=A0A4S9PMF3_AURPU|nr:Six-hairpin glycosidase [Aureobasidium pullulans]THZ42645.1 Six-hairpin glycosidase [Aureobasidium pullulans]THZ55751.1 Six-hairpin glycosidase [Aureobasidium pullulans]TIA74808.1 Six-hairpin glycosidase [Aureobasidium pullulans]
MRRPLAVALTTLLSSSAATVPYAEYILAPSQRDLFPVKVHQANGTVTNAAGVTTSGSGGTTFNSVSAVTYDYTKNIGGLVSFVVSSASDSEQYIGISYTESSLWISPDGSDATQNIAIDETLWFKITGPGNYSVEPLHDRGGFRYLNVYHNTTGNVTLSHLQTYFTAMPHFPDDGIGEYTGYFHSNDEKLNRVWYAGAYTDQLCTIPSTAGNSLVDLDATDPNTPTVWWSNSTLTNGSSAFTDGPKRDKLVWPGDFAISVPGVFLSTDDAITVKLSLQQLFASQNATTGALPWFAQPIYVFPENSFINFGKVVFSFNYHLFTLLGLHNYWIYTGDDEYLQQNWNRFKLALNYSLSFVDETGLANVTSSFDWLREGMGGHNIEANSILKHTLDVAVTLAYAVNDTSHIASWTNSSAAIVSAANTLLWDSSASLYKDNETTTLHPQDGNVWSIISGVASANQSTDISGALAARWGPYGAPAPEAGTTVSPFITGFELQAHFLAGQPQRAIELMQFMWADFMLDDPRMTNSTYIEGYDTSGALHYPAYADDARISHAHGWSSGPVLALSTFAVGLHVLNATNWIAHPQPGNLTNVEAGFKVDHGHYSGNYSVTAKGASYVLSTPPGTKGSLVLDTPGCNANIKVTGASSDVGGKHGKKFNWAKQVRGHKGVTSNPWKCGVWGPSPPAHQDGSAGTITIDNLAGGNYTVDIVCS